MEQIRRTIEETLANLKNAVLPSEWEKLNEKQKEFNQFNLDWMAHTIVSNPGYYITDFYYAQENTQIVCVLYNPETEDRTSTTLIIDTKQKLNR